MLLGGLRTLVAWGRGNFEKAGKLGLSLGTNEVRRLSPWFPGRFYMRLLVNPEPARGVYLDLHTWSIADEGLLPSLCRPGDLVKRVSRCPGEGMSGGLCRRCSGRMT